MWAFCQVLGKYVIHPLVYGRSKICLFKIWPLRASSRDARRYVPSLHPTVCITWRFSFPFSTYPAGAVLTASELRLSLPGTNALAQVQQGRYTVPAWVPMRSLDFWLKTVLLHRLSNEPEPPCAPRAYPDRSQARCFPVRVWFCSNSDCLQKMGSTSFRFLLSWLSMAKYYWRQTGHRLVNYLHQ